MPLIPVKEDWWLLRITKNSLLFKKGGFPATDAKESFSGVNKYRIKTKLSSVLDPQVYLYQFITKVYSEFSPGKFHFWLFRKCFGGSYDWGKVSFSTSSREFSFHKTFRANLSLFIFKFERGDFFQAVQVGQIQDWVCFPKRKILFRFSSNKVKIRKKKHHFSTQVMFFPFERQSRRRNFNFLDGRLTFSLAALVPVISSDGKVMNTNFLSFFGLNEG